MGRLLAPYRLVVGFLREQTSSTVMTVITVIDAVVSGACGVTVGAGLRHAIRLIVTVEGSVEPS